MVQTYTQIKIMIFKMGICFLVYLANSVFSHDHRGLTGCQMPVIAFIQSFIMTGNKSVHYTRCKRSWSRGCLLFELITFMKKTWLIKFLSYNAIHRYSASVQHPERHVFDLSTLCGLPMSRRYTPTPGSSPLSMRLGI